MARLVRFGLTLITLSYPLWVYLGLNYGNFSFLLVLLAVIGIMHGVRAARGERISWLWFAVCALLLTWSIGMGSSLGIKFYPVAINIGLLLFFAWSLYHPPTVIERIARFSEPDLSPAGVNYTRNVTLTWCGFFVLNGSVAFLTLFASDEVWALYNGLLSYLLMGLLMGGEWLYRRHHRRQHA